MARSLQLWTPRIAQKSWSATGTYTVRAKAKDIHGVTSEWSTPIQYNNNDGSPTNHSNHNGKAEGKPGTPYSYTLTTIDPDGDMVYYYIDWGDNTWTDWVGPYDSGGPLQ